MFAGECRLILSRAARAIAEKSINADASPLGDSPLGSFVADAHAQLRFDSPALASIRCLKNQLFTHPSRGLAKRSGVDAPGRTGQGADMHNRIAVDVWRRQREVSHSLVLTTATGHGLEDETAGQHQER